MDRFKQKLETYFDEFFRLVSTDNGDWTVKGFIDIYKTIYTISVDTKVISKIVELMVFPVFVKFANENDYEMVLSSYQNHYPDISFIHKKTNDKIALDLKSTYRINRSKVNGMTLGAFTGYFRNRNSNKNITFPYSEYSKHYVLGFIYSKTDLHNVEEKLVRNDISLNQTQRKKLSQYLSIQSTDKFNEFFNLISKDKEFDREEIKGLISDCIINERKTYTIEDLPNILSVIRDFDFFLQEKWKIAIDRPGSGNTKNIGSVTSIDELKKGTGLFTQYKNGEKLFNDYWKYYLTKDMAKAVELDEPPYHNLKSYFEYKGIPNG